MKTSVSPFDILKTINESKRNLINDGTITKKDYKDMTFIINKGMSLFPETVFLANYMNLSYDLPANMQYDFYLASVRSKKRYAKWPKANDKSSEDFEIVQEYYSLNKEKTNEFLSILTKEQIQILKEKLNKGGL